MQNYINIVHLRKSDVVLN